MGEKLRRMEEARKEGKSEEGGSVAMSRMRHHVSGMYDLRVCVCVCVCVCDSKYEQEKQGDMEGSRVSKRIERQDKKTQEVEGEKEGRRWRGRAVTDNTVVLRLPQGQTRQRERKKERKKKGEWDTKAENAEIYRAARGRKGYEMEGEQRWRDGIGKDWRHKEEHCSER